MTFNWINYKPRALQSIKLGAASMPVAGWRTMGVNTTCRTLIPVLQKSEFFLIFFSEYTSN